MKNMNKKQLAIGILGLFVLILSMSFSSASHDYYNYRDGYYDDGYSYTGSRYSMPYYPQYSKSTHYDKSYSSGYLPDGSYASTTVYSKTNIESPGYAPLNYGSSYPRTYYRFNYHPMNYYYHQPHYYRYW